MILHRIWFISDKLYVFGTGTWKKQEVWREIGKNEVGKFEPKLKSITEIGKQLLKFESFGKNHRSWKVLSKLT